MLNINTLENREELAEEMVEGWDLEDTLLYARRKLLDDFNAMSDEEFEVEYKAFYITEDEGYSF